MDAYETAIKYARSRGEHDGRNAAAWYAQDTFGGRVTRGAAESAARILRGIEDGDPEVLDSLPFADLSGQWADTLTGPQLVDDALYSAGLAEDEDGNPPAEASDWFADICDAYEAAFSDASQDEIVRMARLTIAD